jgi:hypothetical protein
MSKILTALAVLTSTAFFSNAALAKAPRAHGATAKAAHHRKAKPTSGPDLSRAAKKPSRPAA